MARASSPAGCQGRNATRTPSVSGRRPATVLAAVSAAVVLGLPCQALASLSFAGSFETVSPPATPEGYQARFPSDLAVGDDASVYVTFGPYVQHYDQAGRLLATWGGPGSAPGKFGGSFLGGSAGAIAGDEGGHLYVADPSMHRIHKFRANGVHVATWGRNGGDGSPGLGPAEFDRPFDLTSDGSTLLVSETPFAGGRLEKLSLDGTSLWEVEALEHGYVAPAEDGDYLFRGFQAIGITRLNGSNLSWASELSTIVWDEATPGRRNYASCCGLARVGNTVWVGDFGQSRLEQFSLDGAFLYACGSPERPVYSYPAPLASGPRETLYVLRGRTVDWYSQAPSGQPCDALRPTFEELTLSARLVRRRPARLSVVVRFALSESAKARIRLVRLRAGRRVDGRCVPATKRHRKRSTCVRALRRFEKRIDIAHRAGLRITLRAGRRLRSPRRYRVEISVTDLAGNVSTRTMPFTLRDSSGAAAPRA